MSTHRFKQVDVFTTRPLYGNPVAVVLDTDGLTAPDMQRLAAWTNLSETTFVLPPTSPEADYRLRIFSPKGELSFAGHPTIGSAHAILESGIVQAKSSRLVQECGAGLLNLRIEPEKSERRIFVQTPEAKVSAIALSFRDRITSAIKANLAPGSSPLLVEVGPVWLVVQLDSTEAVHALQPDMIAIARLSHDLNMTGITVFGLTETEQSQVYTRSFAPAMGIPEDPVCGSGNASVAAFLAHTDKLGLTGETYVANQGLEVGRNGFVAVRVKLPGLSIEIGGASVTCIEGSLRL